MSLSNDRLIFSANVQITYPYRYPSETSGYQWFRWCTKFENVSRHFSERDDIYAQTRMFIFYQKTEVVRKFMRYNADRGSLRIEISSVPEISNILYLGGNSRSFGYDLCKIPRSIARCVDSYNDTVASLTALFDTCGLNINGRLLIRSLGDYYNTWITFTEERNYQLVD